MNKHYILQKLININACAKCSLSMNGYYYYYWHSYDEKTWASIAYMLNCSNWKEFPYQTGHGPAIYICDGRINFCPEFRTRDDLDLFISDIIKQLQKENEIISLI